jgi:hypothetical protein
MVVILDVDGLREVASGRTSDMIQDSDQNSGDSKPSDYGTREAFLPD